MDKAQALYQFWSNFLPAYDENNVPDDAELPYITYMTATDSLGYVVQLNGSIWYRSTRWDEITKKADEIAEYIGYGGKVVKLDDGYMWLTKGTPFAQRMRDEDDSIRRIYINIQAEYLTAY